MRISTPFLSFLSAAALAGCASSPGFVEENWDDSAQQIPPEYDVDAGLNSQDGVIPPGARARRQQRAIPGFAGPRHASSDVSEEAFAAAPPEEYDPRPPQASLAAVAAPASAEEQVQSEVDAELERRSKAFGSSQMGQPEDINLGHRAGLTRIQPRPDFSGDSGGLAPLGIEPDTQRQGIYRVSAPRYGARGSRPVPVGAPPLPPGVRPGDCLTIVHAVSSYGGPVQPEWRTVVCESDRSPALVTDLQRALLRAGYPPGPIDGIFGPRTRAALKAYQRSRFLPDDGRLHLGVLQDLGIFRSALY